MIVSVVDPRTMPKLVAVDQAAFYVTIWSQSEQKAGIPAGWAAKEYVIHGASSMDDVEDWAASNSGNDLVEIFVAVPPGAGDSVDGVSVRLRGHDPTEINHQS